LAHVEAGLRSFDMQMPEEINRILTDRISDLLFCPTEQALKNLRLEGFENFGCKIYQTGDIMYDAALYYTQKAEQKQEIAGKKLQEEYILCTIHRAENTDNPDRLKSIFNALDIINEEKKIILPLHPRTKAILEKEKIVSNISIIEPVGYLEMLQLIRNCKLVITDSGGLQKEAYFFGKKCIVLRDTTEWVELMDNGFVELAGSSKQAIVRSFKHLSVTHPGCNHQLYGDGACAPKIVKIITDAR